MTQKTDRWPSNLNDLPDRMNDRAQSETIAPTSCSDRYPTRTIFHATKSPEHHRPAVPFAFARPECWLRNNSMNPFRTHSDNNAC